MGGRRSTVDWHTGQKSTLHYKNSNTCEGVYSLCLCEELVSLFLTGGRGSERYCRIDG